MLNLDSEIDLDIRKFLRWWGRELLELMPEKLRRLVKSSQSQIIVRPAGVRFEVTHSLDGNVEDMGRFDRNVEGMDELRNRLGQDARYEKADLVIRLSEQDAIVKKLVFPIAAAENLKQVAAYELDRFTPFKVAHAYFAVKIVEKNKKSAQVSAMLVVTPRERLDALIEPFNEAGIQIARVDIEGLDNGTDDEFAYDLLPPHFRKKTPLFPGIVNGGLTVLLCALLITAMVLPVWREGRSVDKLRVIVNDMEREARSVDDLQKEADALIAQTEQLIKNKQAQPSIVEMLNELSRLINDDTWLTYLQYTNGRMQFQGQSPSASTLIGVLEDSPVFSNARFVSPVTQDPRGGFERFQITTDVVANQ